MGTAFTADALLAELRAHADPDNVAGMARYGISSEGTLGVPMPVLRDVAKRVKREWKRDPESRHALAAELWASGVHEARVLAALVDAPELVSREQAEAWAADLDSWDVCDQLTANLLDKTPMAYDLVREWSAREETFVKRAAFSLAATLASHDKAAPDERFLAILALVDREAEDPRPMVRKAVNWALRGIGKRNAALHAPALALSMRLRDGERKSARWVGADAARELDSDAVRGRLGL